jgi:hypothetical protein
LRLICTLALQFGFGEVAVAEQRLIEIEVVGSHLTHRFGFAVGDISADAERQVIGSNAVARFRQAAGVIADD